MFRDDQRKSNVGVICELYSIWFRTVCLNVLISRARSVSATLKSLTNQFSKESQLYSLLSNSSPMSSSLRVASLVQLAFQESLALLE